VYVDLVKERVYAGDGVGAQPARFLRLPPVVPDPARAWWYSR
jgi:hypothetical protein